MKARSTRAISALFAWAAALGVAGAAAAAELNHYAGGMLNIRDFNVPDPGFYTVLYNYYYRSHRINDNSGDKSDSVTIGSGPSVTLGLDVDLDLYALMPTLIWVLPWQPAGVRWGMLVAPTFANTSLGASLATGTGRGRNADTGQFAAGDLFVQPIWLGWSSKHVDLNFGYGFWAPTGKYDTEIATFPVIGSRRVEDPDNIGYGFWNQQIQGAGTWYPFDNKGTAVVGALTYEQNFDKHHFDITPGSYLTLNWGISQYLPLSSSQTALLEIGPWGYSTWQVSKDTGSQASPGDSLDQVHGVGGQLGFTYVPWKMALNAHYAYEFHAESRFQGQVIGATVAVGFGGSHAEH